MGMFALEKLLVVPGETRLWGGPSVLLTCASDKFLGALLSPRGKVTVFSYKAMLKKHLERMMPVPVRTPQPRLEETAPSWLCYFRILFMSLHVCQQTSLTQLEVKPPCLLSLYLAVPGKLGTHLMWGTQSPRGTLSPLPDTLFHHYPEGPKASIPADIQILLDRVTFKSLSA